MGPSVDMSGEVMSLRVFISERDSFEGKPLHEVIVKKARELHLAGATVTRGIMGYGAYSRIHTAKLLRLSEDLPVVVEVVDSMNHLNELISFLNTTVRQGLITLEKVRVIKYSHGEEKQ